jgi:hypothetical protein
VIFAGRLLHVVSFVSFEMINLCGRAHRRGVKQPAHLPVLALRSALNRLLKDRSGRYSGVSSGQRDGHEAFAHGCRAAGESTHCLSGLLRPDEVVRKNCQTQTHRDAVPFIHHLGAVVFASIVLACPPKMALVPYLSFMTKMIFRM